MYAFDHEGTIIAFLVIKANRALNLMNAFTVEHVSRVEVDVLESGTTIVFPVGLGLGLILAVVGVGDQLVAAVFSSKAVGHLVMDILADELLHATVEAVVQPAEVVCTANFPLMLDVYVQFFHHAFPDGREASSFIL